jgi:putative membrane protein
MTSSQLHPALNAALNATCFVFLVLGRMAIARGDVALHRRRMLGAFTASTVFLISYMIRWAISGTHRYPGDGIDKTIYLITLFTHMVCAIVLLPLVVRALQLALTSRFDAHRRIVKWTWPIWMYVSVTGVLVYLMLYHLAPVLHPAAG